MFQPYEDYKKYELLDKSENTIIAYTRAIEEFISYFNLETLEDYEAITPIELRKYQKSLIDGGLGESSVNFKFQVLKAFANFLVDTEITKVNRIAKVPNLKVAQKAVFALSKEEVVAMLNACKTTDERLMILLMVTSGLRRTEVANIKISDIEGCQIRVIGKGNKEVLIPLTDEVCELMATYLHTRKIESDYLFVGKGTHAGISDEAVSVRVKRIAQDALPAEVAKKVTPHTLRKTFVTDIVKVYGLVAGQIAARHASPNTTRACYVDDDKVFDKNVLRGKSYMEEG